MRWLLLLILVHFLVPSRAQKTETDSLKILLAVTQDKKEIVRLLENLSYAYVSSYPDTALQYAKKGLELAKEINFANGVAICTNALGNVYASMGDNVKALQFYLRYLQMKDSLNDRRNISVAYYNIASVYTEDKDYPYALFYFYKAKNEDEKLKDSTAILYDCYSLASVYLRMEKFDSALLFLDQSYRLGLDLDDRNMMGAILNTYGELYLSRKDIERAAKYYQRSIPYITVINDNEVLASTYYGLARIFLEKANSDSAIFYGRQALLIAKKGPFFKQILEISDFLTGVFRTRGNVDSAFHYQTLNMTTKDSLFNVEEAKKVQRLKFEEEQRQQEIATAKIQYRSKVNLLAVVFVSVVFLVIALILWQNNRQKKKANALLQQEKEKVEEALAELKSTQNQLIQSEKMASLGVLTAGIAHEIKNPLNFVNNFSDVNEELLTEMKDELRKGKIDHAIALANDAIENQKKINYHGKRADAIIKGMLQHSRTNSGQKELIDVNTLADEYLRLAFHGLRAKDKSFNAKFETDFDPSIEQLNVVPQDIGRVLLNLINNAFYAVNEKRKENINGYEPTVLVSTRKDYGIIEIKIKDNGDGIPQKVLDKIFQPFFTTKPTGEGTGLGLSLAYDIVKAHGGEIVVQTEEGKGSEFTLRLPNQ